MWPFDRLRKRKHDRRYNAALIVFLGTSMFDSFTAEQKGRVVSEVNDNFNRTDTPAVAWNRVIAWDLLSAFRATAMDRLGVQPCVPGLSWVELFQPWRFWRKIPEWPRKPFDSRAVRLVNDFKPFDPATVEAKQLLLGHGMRLVDGYTTSLYTTTNESLGA